MIGPMSNVPIHEKVTSNLNFCTNPLRTYIPNSSIHTRLFMYIYIIYIYTVSYETITFYLLVRTCSTNTRVTNYLDGIIGSQDFCTPPTSSICSYMSLVF